MARDDLGKLRGLAGEKGYRLDKLPQRGCWQLINEETGEIAKRPDGATAFNAAQALSFFGQMPKRGEHP